ITPLYPFHSHEICQYPHVKINQQNNRGETALLYSLIKRKGYRIGNLFIDTIKELLKKGADPELGNKYGLTPLMAAKDLGNNDIISLIEQAIQDKQSVIPASVIKSPL
ncbi:MAG TPA: ankyrin repeat domain-containing protein, partial [Candidatus Babeliales bacterium]|nr:ankyrin repeat domain-containing protein [Candidatus Babeliales bacterium]